MATQYKRQAQDEDDILRARFTAWLNTTLFRARAKYIARLEREPDMISIEDIPAEYLEDPVDPFMRVEESSSKDFDFEEERLAISFRELPLMRREVLRLLFVEERTTKEIAKILNCTENYVHLQKSRALKRLREELLNGGSYHDQG